MNISRNAPVDPLAFSSRMPVGKLDVRDKRAAADADQTAVASAPIPTCGEPNSASGSVASGPYDGSDFVQLGTSWGQEGSRFDLDGNGAVDINDLLAMISAWQSPEAGTAGVGAAEPTEVDTSAIATDVKPAVTAELDAVQSTASADVVSTDTPASEPPVPQSDLDALLAQWGQADSKFDFDADGAVDIDDLLTLIGTAPAASAQTSTIATFADSGDAESESLTEVRSSNRRADAEALVAARSSGVERTDSAGLTAADAKKLSASLIDRLTAAGFADRPPTNIAELVQKLNLQPGDTKRLFADLRERYPQSLGVNLTA